MAGNAKVQVWEEQVVIPTYPAGKPEKSPLFIEKRAYQGSTGKVYPLPVTETISDEKKDVAYRAVFLENEYLKIMILPELGGRIQRAYDKTNGYDFVYYNHVIRPALVGLAGPWISGGIEFNWPQHHRPSTFAPVDYTFKAKDDGSCTVYLSETDRMYGTKGMAEISLYPGKAYIEIRGRLFNGTDLPQTFLWWANPAVPVNDRTYSVFPPDVNAVMDHGKRAVSTFPIATGEYYKADYSAGVDISRYKNIKVPTSYMAAHSDFNFIGNYDEGRQAGLLHVADHHVSPGKKQWTWGNGDFGRMWDWNLTETDGPYIELMTGVYTDNQPDFSWLKPQEEKTFVQYFMPYKGVGRVGNATKDAMVSLARGEDGRITAKLYATARYPQAELIVKYKGAKVQKIPVDVSPDACAEVSFDVPSAGCVSGQGLQPQAGSAGTFDAASADCISGRDFQPHSGSDSSFDAPFADSDCSVSLEWRGRTLVEYTVYEKKPAPVPEPAKPIPAPEELRSTEELYLAASHLEQYRHAMREPADYYLEGLRRDATDIRLNNGYGLLLLRRGRVKESIPYFRAAVKKQTWRNPNPYNGDCYFNLGLALAAAGQEEEAYDAFFKSTWSAETQRAGFYWLAALETRRGFCENQKARLKAPESGVFPAGLPGEGEQADMSHYENALAFVEKSLLCSWHNMKARALKAALLRRLGRENGSFLAESCAIDPLHMGCLYEQALQSGGRAAERGANERAIGSSGRAAECGVNELASGSGGRAAERRANGQTVGSSGRAAECGVNELASRSSGWAAECEANERASGGRAAWRKAMRDEAHNYLTLSLDYMDAGLWEEALDILGEAPVQTPLCLYYEGYAQERSGNPEAARASFAKAEAADPEYGFPNRVHEIAILETAIRLLPAAPMAHYYLGSLLYDKKSYREAQLHWEQAVKEKPELAMAYRNLSIAYYNKEKNTKKALEALSRACALDCDYPRLWLEYDQLLAKANRPVAERLERMEEHANLLKKRDDLYLRHIALLNCEGRFAEALAALESHQFHPWEGGEGKSSAQYRFALIHLAIGELEAQSPEKALGYLERALHYPTFLGEGKLPNVPDNQIHYYMGLACRMSGDEPSASHYLELAASGPQEPSQVLYYNDQPSDYIFYQGLANRALGREEKARGSFHRLVSYGERHLFDEVDYDFFAVSLPEIEVYQEDLEGRNRRYCNYLRALGALGLGETRQAETLLEDILKEQADYQGAIEHLWLLKGSKSA